MKKERSLIFVSILVILLFAVLTPVSLQANDQKPFVNNESSLEATITSTIYIHNNAELQALAISCSGSPGSGSPADPWIIRDLVINTTDTLGLRIDDTTEYFEILNCTVTASWGIYLDNLADSTARIRNNTVINCDSYGIYLYMANGTNYTYS
jgi:parallel beta-helix repeat protein